MSKSNFAARGFPQRQRHYTISQMWNLFLCPFSTDFDPVSRTFPRATFFIFMNFRISEFLGMISDQATKNRADAKALTALRVDSQPASLTDTDWPIIGWVAKHTYPTILLS